MSNLFKQLEYEAFRAGIKPRSKKSMAWFRKRTQELGGINRGNLMRMTPMEKTQTFSPGQMIMYFYDPKHKATLPYYDKFPLSIIVGPAQDGFYGLNLHYLPLTLRAKFLDALLDIMNNQRYDDTTKFEISYKMLKHASTMKYFKPCFKHYLLDHVVSNFSRVPPPEFEIATFLPTASWSGESESHIHSQSRKKI